MLGDWGYVGLFDGFIGEKGKEGREGGNMDRRGRAERRM